MRRRGQVEGWLVGSRFANSKASGSIEYSSSYEHVKWWYMETAGGFPTVGGGEFGVG